MRFAIGIPLLFALALTAPPANAASAPDSAAAPAKPRPSASPRTLQDIHIEGEVPVPQVLFVTARDQRRLTEFQHRRYLKNSLGVGRGVAVPTRLTVSPATPAARKESTR